MKRTYSKAEAQNPVEILRKAGYAFFRDPQSGEESFVVRLTPEFYPRLHLYVEHDSEQVTFNLHLDQKKPSYGANTQHSGEYDGPIIESELKRIDSWVRASANQAQSNTAEHDIDQKNNLSQKTEGNLLQKLWRRFFSLKPQPPTDDRIER
jgi:hypothetical protein